MADTVSEQLRESMAALLGAQSTGVDTSALEGFGWPELYAQDPRLAVTVLFEEMGRSPTKVAALEVLVKQHLQNELPAQADIAVLRPDGSGCAAIAAGSGDVTGTLLNGWKSFDHLVAIDLGAEPAALVLAADDVVLTPVAGVDPRAGAAAARGPLNILTVVEPAATENVVGAIRRALAIEQVAIGHEMLRTAVDHTSSRVQFGRPIGANQSVQHRLAELHVALKAAQSAIEESWQSNCALAVAVAAGLAARAVDIAIRSSLQVCGGMGFTEEFALAPLIRRSVLLSEVFDDETRLARTVGAAVLGAARAHGGLPRLGSFADVSPQ
jgi:hypothetical protein